MKTFRGFVALGFALLILIGLAALGRAGWYMIRHISSRQMLPTNHASTILTVSGPSAPTQKPELSATIDQRSLTTHLSRPEVTGTAQLKTVDVGIYDALTGSVEQSAGALPVINGAWSYKPCSPLVAGTYLVQVSNFDRVQSDQRTGRILNSGVSVLASGTLTIKTPVTAEAGCARDAI